MINQNEKRIQELFDKLWDTIFNLADELEERAEKEGLTDKEWDFLEALDEFCEAIEDKECD